MKSRRDFLKGALSTSTLLQLSGMGSLASLTKALGADRTNFQGKNVLFIAIDDLNDWIRCLTPSIYPGLTPFTPNIDRLAREGMLFQNAHTPFALCNPARTAIFYGAEPHLSGVVGNHKTFDSEFYHLKNCYFKDRQTLNAFFKANGYETLGLGKLYHGTNALLTDGKFDTYIDVLANDPKRCRITHGDPRLEQRVRYAQIDTGAAKAGCDDGLIHVDEFTANTAVGWIQEQIAQKRQNPNAKPFFMGVGFYRPHAPYISPQWAWDKYPKEAVKGFVDSILSSTTEPMHPKISPYFAARIKQSANDLRSGDLYENIRGYLAAITFVDYCIGKVLNSLRNSPLWNDTIVVMVSDHGYHNGEKQLQAKNTLWERATRVPLIVRLPGVMEGRKSDSLVSTLALYKTLTDLCFPSGKRPTGIDGISFAPVLFNPNREVQPVVRTALALDPDSMSIDSVNAMGYTVRDKNWRYILYRIKTPGGFEMVEELYYLPKDPQEKFNLVLNGRGSHEATCERLKQHVPRAFSQIAPMPRLNCRGNK